MMRNSAISAALAASLLATAVPAQAHDSWGGGAIPERLDNIGRHYLVIDVDPDRGVESVRVSRVDE